MLEYKWTLPHATAYPRTAADYRILFAPSNMPYAPLKNDTSKQKCQQQVLANPVFTLCSSPTHTHSTRWQCHSTLECCKYASHWLAVVCAVGSCFEPSVSAAAHNNSPQTTPHSTPVLAPSSQHIQSLTSSGSKHKLPACALQRWKNRLQLQLRKALCGHAAQKCSQLLHPVTDVPNS